MFKSGGGGAPGVEVPIHRDPAAGHAAERRIVDRVDHAQVDHARRSRGMGQDLAPCGWQNCV